MLNKSPKYLRLINIIIDISVIKFLLIPLIVFLLPTIDWNHNPYFKGSCIFFMYYLIFEYGINQTIGKLITGTKVISINNGYPSWQQITKRTFVRFIPFEGLTFLWGLDLHDHLSKTYVVCEYTTYKEYIKNRFKISL